MQLNETLHLRSVVKLCGQERPYLSRAKPSISFEHTRVLSELFAFVTPAVVSQFVSKIRLQNHTPLTNSLYASSPDQ